MDGSQSSHAQEDSAFFYFPSAGGQSRQTYLQGSIQPYPAARNILESWHGASERCEPASAFTLNEGFQCFANQCSFLRDTSEFLGEAYEIVVKYNCCSHRESRHLL